MPNTYEPGELARQVFHEAKMWQAYEWMGAHEVVENNEKGFRFLLWAPNAQAVSLVADCNDWDVNKTPLYQLESDPSLWTVFVKDAYPDMNYQYAIYGADNVLRFKSDPYAFTSSVRPNTASKTISANNYQWKDEIWQNKQTKKLAKKTATPLAIYEVHLGSWMRHDDDSFYTYRELADSLIPYVKELGFTHIELLPIMEHPLDASWGYQITSYFAPTSRFGTPDDLKYFIDKAHQNDIGVFLDWVPAHFCKDDHGLRLLDGSPLYEYKDSNRAENKGWGTLHFDLTKGEVVSFLISNAIYWLKEFHFDGLRVDAVACMLYLDYDKEPGEWSPNIYGGRENIESINFLRYLNKITHEIIPTATIMAEESTTWPKVTAKEEFGGLGFDYKWNMGWMNDSLRYMETDSLFRKNCHDLLTFPITYAFTEKFILPLSHDEVVHGKRSYLNKMPGDYWQQFANLRAFYGYWMMQPGKKLLFMGSEFGQYIEWNENQKLDWSLLKFEKHEKVRNYLKKLLEVYKKYPFLYSSDCDYKGFEWMDCNNKNQSLISFVRYEKNSPNHGLVICNFTPETYSNYKVPVPKEGAYYEVLNSDSKDFGGSNVTNSDEILTIAKSYNYQDQYIEIKIPPLATVLLVYKELPKQLVNTVE